VTLEEEVIRLRAENEELRRLLAKAVERIAELERGLGETAKRREQVPSFVKPDRPKAASQKPRRKRDQQHNHGRRLTPPTESVEHALERCPECRYRIRGKSLDYVRQVIELPKPVPVEVTEHRVLRRYCPKCQRWRSPKLDLGGAGESGQRQVLGRGRIGIRLISLIATLRHELRLPFERIQRYLETFHAFKVSLGELVYLLEQVRETTKGEVERLKREMQASKVLHADETGWREDGQNGYIWSFSTPGSPDGRDTGKDPIRYYEFDQSRSQAVPRRILADRFKGHIVSDFYCGYNDYPSKHQRCWVHLFRDLKELREEHPDKPEVLEWAAKVRALHDEAKEWLERNRDPSQEGREREYVSLVGRAHQLGLLYSGDKSHPCFALCKRLVRHEDELFQFVLVEGLASDNNLAERSIRPLVVVRKISGGSRSPNGTKTRMALATLFETWRARGLNPYHESLKLLSQQLVTPAP
jgi:transposase